MFERFTKGVIKVIMLSQDEARRMGHNTVGTEQLLLGLAGEKEGFAAQTLVDAGLKLEQLRAQVEKETGRGSGFVAVEIPFTLRAKRSLELALEASKLAAGSNVDTEHLLAGVLQQKDCTACKVLRALEIEPDSLETILEEQIAQGSPVRAFLGNLRPAKRDAENLACLLVSTRQNLDELCVQLRNPDNTEVFKDSQVKNELSGFRDELEKLSHVFKQYSEKLVGDLSTLHLEINKYVEPD